MSTPATQTGRLVALNVGRPSDVEWQGRTVPEIEKDYPGAIATWRSDPAWAPPGGEVRDVPVCAACRAALAEREAGRADLLNLASAMGDGRDQFVGVAIRRVSGRQVGEPV